jgi:hypothetical protein
MVAEKKLSSVQPFRPSKIHSFYRWIDRLPGPYWLYYAGIVVVAGLLNNVVAWREQVLAPGEINAYYGLTAFFIGYYLFVNDILLRVARESLIEIQPLLGIPGSERDRIIFGFTHIPEKGSTVAFVVGAGIGFVLALMQVQTAVEMNNAFPEFEVPIFSLTFGMISFSVYHVAWAFTRIKKVFGNLKTVDIYDQNSIYALSRYCGLVVVLTAVAIFLTFVLAPSLTELASYYWVAFNASVGVLALAIFWLPLRAVNHKLVSEKCRLLKDVSLRIKNMFELIHSRLDEHELKDIAELRGALDALRAEREYIESIRTWPWRPATLTGVLTAIVLPLLIGLLLKVLSRLLNF